ncbi:MAG: DUF4388 domain-containing protein, partial [Acidobacteria bacterium]|nr:DUF4388 domain-containing protein [Acidobacteriota bacterium]
MGEFLEGRLHPPTIFFLMRMIAVERMSGALTVDQGRINKRIFFLDGDPVYASSNLATDGLGERLLLDGHLSLEDFERVTRKLRPGRRFGFILVELGLFSEDEVKERLEEQVVAIYQSLFQATVGRFRFDKHVYANEDYQVLVPSVPQILRAARATNLDRFQALLLRSSAATVSPPANLPPGAVDALLPAEKLLVEKICGETPISDILQGLDRYDENLLSSLFAAVFSGFLDFDSEQENLSYETRVEEGEPAAHPAPPPAPALAPAAATQSVPPEIVEEPASATQSTPPEIVEEPASATQSGPPKIVEEPASATPTQAIPPSEDPEAPFPSPEELAAESKGEERLRKALALQKDGSQKEALDVLLNAVRKAPERLRNIYDLTFSLVAFHAHKAQEGRQARASDAPLPPKEEEELVEQQKILPLDLRDLVRLDRQNWLLWVAGFALVLVLTFLAGSLILSPPVHLPSTNSTDTVEVVLRYLLV